MFWLTGTSTTNYWTRYITCVHLCVREEVQGATYLAHLAAWSRRSLAGSERRGLTTWTQQLESNMVGIPWHEKVEDEPETS